MKPFWLLAAVAAAAFSSGVSHAQTNDRPYSFGSGPIGMSKAGRQAIIDRDLGGITPDNLFRDGLGDVVSAKPGPGGVVVLSGRDGVRNIGRAGRQSPLSQGAGRFNSFFYKRAHLSRGPYYPSSYSTSSSQTIDGWTGNVQGATTIGGNSVDVWTSMVYYLSY